MDLMVIVATAVVTFAITAFWNLWATKKIRQNHQMMATSLVAEMNEMAKKLGHEDLYAYFAQVKGEQYANTTMANIKSFADSFSDRGAD